MAVHPIVQLGDPILRTPALTRQLNPELLTFDQWAARNKGRFST